MSTIPAVSAPIAELAAWGDLAKKSGIVPPSISREQAMAIVQAGRELGLQPFQSLRSMSFINGKLTMSVQLQLALARRQGVRVTSLDETNDSCSVTLVRGEEKISCTYALDDARKAGLVKAGGAWERYGRQMLRWRAIGDALRLIAPDLVMGFMDPVEAESVEPVGPDAAATQEAHPVAEAVPPSPPASPETPPEEGPGAARSEDRPEAGTHPARPAAPVTEAQLKMIHAGFTRLRILDKDARRGWIAACLNRPSVASSKELSKAEASAVIDAIEKELDHRQKGAA
jgi:hypothetical protein